MCIRDRGVVLNDDGELLYSKYLPSKGNPVEIIKGFLEEVYAINPEMCIRDRSYYNRPFHGAGDRT